MAHTKRTPGKSITTSVPSITVHFRADDEELEELYHSEDMDEESANKGEDDSPSVPSATILLETVPTTAQTSTSVTTSASTVPTSTAGGAPSTTVTSSRDPSPMKEYLKSLGKRSTSVDVGVLDGSSGSDTWRIFHELRGKITKTVEEKFSEIKSDRRSGSLSFSDIGKSSKLIGKSKENSSISDSEDVSEASSKTADQKDGTGKVDPSPKRVSLEKLSKKDSSSIEEKDDPDEDSRSTTAQDEASEEGLSTPVQCETDSLGELPIPVKKIPFHAKFRSNISGLRHRHHTSSKPVVNTSITMSSLSSTKEDEKTEDTVEDDIESGVEASEEISAHGQETVITDSTINRLDYKRSTPSNLQAQMKKEPVCKFVGCVSWKSYVFLITFIVFNIYAPVPVFFLGFIDGFLAMYIIFYIHKQFNKLFVPVGVQGSEKTERVVIPDYSAMPILEVPAIKEYQPLTKYAGWMNEYPGIYDPGTYHISDTQSVYIRLEGGTLRISHPRSRIPKRAMWNERAHRLRFSHQRIYSIGGCEVKLLPDGLTRKRLWSKKYPICIILQKPKSEIENSTKETGEAESYHNATDQLSEPETEAVTEFFDPINEGPSEESLPEPDKVSIAEEDDEFSGELSEDDTFCLIEKETTQPSCLYLFARTDREKEDWFRRFAGAALFATSPIDFEEKPAVVTPSHSPPPPPPPPTPKVAAGQAPNEAVVAEVTALLNQAASSAIKSDSQLPVLQSVTSGLSQASQLSFTDYARYMLQFDLEVNESGSSKTSEQHSSEAGFASSSKDVQIKHEETTESEAEQDSIKENEKDMHISGNVMWINALIGRVLFDILSNDHWVLKIQERIQKKLSAIKLPMFLEELIVSELDVGDTIPLIQRASQPVLNERGLWVDLDITYQGLCSLTLETKLNLMKLKKGSLEPTVSRKTASSPSEKRGSPMFDSDLDDSAESSEEESEAYNKSTSEEEATTYSSPGGGTGKKILRMVNKIAASRYFQQATEYKYIKRAMEEVSNTRLLLSVELRGLLGTLALNIPPPPSDRLWYGFRGNPKIWLSARPKLGDRKVNISHVIAWIEKKLIEEVQKKFVLPNMDDLIIPPMATELPYQFPPSGSKSQ